MFVRGVVSGGSVWFAAAAPSNFEIPQKLSHEKSMKSNFYEKWGKIGRLPPTFGACDALDVCTSIHFSGCLRIRWVIDLPFLSSFRLEAVKIYLGYQERL